MNKKQNEKTSNLLTLLMTSNNLPLMTFVVNGKRKTNLLEKIQKQRRNNTKKEKNTK